ncbi:hypothetical protein OPIT5_04835 [Opitutaceae bacterium TAV5]|nr:hypothetical protein OPIT5_04835 [Opitutaceae bacterium TAV5]
MDMSPNALFTQMPTDYSVLREHMGKGLPYQFIRKVTIFGVMEKVQEASSMPIFLTPFFMCRIKINHIFFDCRNLWIRSHCIEG